MGEEGGGNAKLCAEKNLHANSRLAGAAQPCTVISLYGIIEKGHKFGGGFWLNMD